MCSTAAVYNKVSTQFIIIAAASFYSPTSVLPAVIVKLCCAQNKMENKSGIKIIHYCCGRKDGSYRRRGCVHVSLQCRPASADLRTRQIPFPTVLFLFLYQPVSLNKRWGRVEKKNKNRRSHSLERPTDDITAHSVENHWTVIPCVVLSSVLYYLDRKNYMPLKFSRRIYFV